MILTHQWNVSLFKLLPRCNRDTNAATIASGQVEHGWELVNMIAIEISSAYCYSLSSV